MATELDVKNLEEIAKKLRCNVIKMVSTAGSGHLGGSLSAMEVIVYLYFYHMRLDPRNPKWEDRDRFILSKGHCAPVQYAALAERGYFDEDVLWTLRDIGSILQGHPDMKKTPGIEITTGSLGQGLSCGVGMAIGAKLSGKDYKVYVMVGDGEIQSGQIWEAAMAASHHKLDNLVVFVDNNKLQSDGITREIVNIEPIREKWEAFGWEATEINGNNFEEIDAAFQKMDWKNGMPKVIVSNTVKGKGVSFMECAVSWHSGAPTEEQVENAIKEIGGGLQK